MKYLLLTLSLLLGILFSTTLQAEDTYSDAFVKTFGNGKKLFVYVGAEWCVPCQSMKAGPLAQFKNSDLYNRYNFVELDVDKHKDIVAGIPGITTIPHMIIIYNPKDKVVITGYRDYPTLESILKTNATFYGKPIPEYQPK